MVRAKQMLVVVVIAITKATVMPAGLGMAAVN